MLPRSYTIKHNEDDLSLKTVIEAFKDCGESELDRRQRNLEEIIRKLAKDIDAAQTMLELHQGEDVHQDSGDLVPNVTYTGECACQDGNNVPDIACQIEISAKGECVCEDPLGVACQTDTTFLSKSQQRVEEMLTQLETETTKQSEVKLLSAFKVEERILGNS